jgi:hypothetical protein
MFKSIFDEKLVIFQAKMVSLCNFDFKLENFRSSWEISGQAGMSELVFWSKSRNGPIN